MAITAVLQVFGLPSAQAATFLYILDASGSMRAPMQGVQTEEVSDDGNFTTVQGARRFDAARDSLLARLALDERSGAGVGLMVYGHRSASCSDIELVVPPRVGRASEIRAAVARVNPNGPTPISAAMRQARQALVQVPDQERKILLFSDGIESCLGSAMGAARELRASGIPMDIIGFDLNDRAETELAALARATGGSFENRSSGMAPVIEFTPRPQPQPQAKTPPLPVKPSVAPRAPMKMPSPSPTPTDATPSPTVDPPLPFLP